MQGLPDIDIDIDIDNGHHAQSDFICLANALHSSIGQTIIYFSSDNQVPLRTAACQPAEV